MAEECSFAGMQWNTKGESYCCSYWKPTPCSWCGNKICKYHSYRWSYNFSIVRCIRCVATNVHAKIEGEDVSAQTGFDLEILQCCKDLYSPLVKVART